MKKLVSGVMLCGLVLGSACGYASQLEAKVVAQQSVTQRGELVGINSVIRKAGKTLDKSGGNIFAVLGGGLIAVSLLARRRAA